MEKKYRPGERLAEISKEKRNELRQVSGILALAFALSVIEEQGKMIETMLSDSKRHARNYAIFASGFAIIGGLEIIRVFS